MIAKAVEPAETGKLAEEKCQNSRNVVNSRDISNNRDISNKRDISKNRQARDREASNNNKNTIFSKI
jgi:hypothetical protein